MKGLKIIALTLVSFTVLGMIGILLEGKKGGGVSTSSSAVKVKRDVLEGGKGGKGIQVVEKDESFKGTKQVGDKRIAEERKRLLNHSAVHRKSKNERRVKGSRKSNKVVSKRTFASDQNVQKRKMDRYDLGKATFEGIWKILMDITKEDQ